MSGGEVLLIFIVALIVFGPKRLPELGRAIGKVMHELNKAVHDVKGQMETENQQPPKETATELVQSPVPGEAKETESEPRKEDENQRPV